MRYWLVLLTVSVFISSVIASCATTSVNEDLLDVVQGEKVLSLFPNLRHGFGLGVGTSAEGWIDGAVEFWEKHMLPAK
jgi:hypothetical protein